MMAEGDNKSVNMLVSIGDRRSATFQSSCLSAVVGVFRWLPRVLWGNELPLVDGTEGQHEHLDSRWKNSALRSSSSSPSWHACFNPAQVPPPLLLQLLLVVTVAAAASG